MKRSQNVIRPTMDKAAKVIPFAFVGGISGCFFEPETEGFVFQSAQDCARSFPDQIEECRIAYQDALQDAAQSAPRYNNEYECEIDFSDGCDRYNNWYIPAMAGFFFANMLDDDYFKKKKKRYYSKPLYGYRGKYYSGDGNFYSSSSNKSVKVSTSSITKPKSSGTIGQVMSRGGFGKSVSRASSSSRSGG
ncbi:DUF1190 domain-containing protein [Grimontia marina]|uniref:DUF1190 domain-containing protein n=1 Tax=Grimontia marina TaxID=646534 RepID=A0A128FJJ0_9GAMM|nr:DUF1190 domain-containing protein [Grimontia marina]CZF86451.1 hypothetical protein GMA8713_04485 [Grimontia marina]